MAYDILGAGELLVGLDDDYSVVGAGRPLPRRGMPLRGARHGYGHPQPHPGYAPPHGTLLQQQQPSHDGQLILPMSSSGLIANASSATITARPQVKAFRPERIVIANSIATFFTVSDIKVGNKSQLTQAGTLPAEAFIQGAFGVEMRMDTVQTAQDFVFSVNNVDATTSHQFLAVVFGRSVD